MHFVGFARVGRGELFRARWFVGGEGGGYTAVSRAAFRSMDKAIRYGRRMARAMRRGVVSAETVCL